MSRGSESEGEIVESGGEGEGEGEKATSVQHSTRDSSVDRSSRPRSSLSRSPRPLPQLDGPADSYDRYGGSYPDRRRMDERTARDSYRSRPHGNKRRYDEEDHHPRSHQYGRDADRDRDVDRNRDRDVDRNRDRDVDRNRDRDRVRPDSRRFQDRYEPEAGRPRHDAHRNVRRGSPGELNDRRHRYDSDPRRGNARRDGQADQGREPPEKRHRSDTHRDRSRSPNAQRFYSQSFVRAERDVSSRDHRTAPGPVPAEQNKRTRDHEARPLGTAKSQEKDANMAEKANEHNEPEPQPVDENKEIEERRKRREAIRAKHRGPATTLLQQALHQKTALNTASSAAIPETPSEGSGAVSSETSPAVSQPGSPLSVAAFSVSNDDELANPAQSTPDPQNPTEEAAAADYDPSMDMQETKLRQRPSIDGAVHRDTTDGSNRDNVAADDSLEPQRPRINREFDMFADDEDLDNDEDDMFAMNPAAIHKKADGTQASRIPQAKQLDRSMLDDWDDAEGYYRIILGELLDGRYHIQTNLGKGVFSAVVRAMDSMTDTLVAIKIIRTQESMYKAGIKEIDTLQRIAEADPEDKKHIIRLIRSFEHKGHLCMVFENLSINLREVLKKFGRDIGINIKAVRSYAQQMFLGLSLLKKCEILHADLKPDNVLVNESRSQLKIADLGSAISADDNEVTDALVSRFYRAPEIMLGIKHDYAIDMWSIGCTLFELYTGKICFTAPTNNQMLKAIMECRGKIPNRMLKKSEFWAQHFDPDGTFLSQEFDVITRREVIRRVNITKTTPAKELKTRLFNNAKGLSVADAKELNLFADLLDKCLAVDPARRITPTDALKHGFINRSAFAGK
ncbi:hypothetical protein MBLNU459_g2111t1 [Dothideomycetes sp. NU459]